MSDTFRQGAIVLLKEELLSSRSSLQRRTSLFKKFTSKKNFSLQEVLFKEELLFSRSSLEKRKITERVKQLDTASSVQLPHKLIIMTKHILIISNIFQYLLKSEIHIIKIENTFIFNLRRKIIKLLVALRLPHKFREWNLYINKNIPNCPLKSPIYWPWCIKTKKI